MDSTPKYMIGVAASLIGMHPQTLRLYEARGLVRPRRTPGGTRLYSDRDLGRLRAIQALTGELGLSLSGVEHVMQLQDTIAGLRDRVARLEAAMDRDEAAHEQALRELARSHRRDVVVYQPPSQALVRRRRPLKPEI